MKHVIVPNLAMLEKKVLVFPSNLTDAHWTVTFVFNASHIQHNVDAEVDSGWRQPCFFWYCSLVTDGSQYTSTEEKIPWFWISVTVMSFTREQNKIQETQWNDMHHTAILPRRDCLEPKSYCIAHLQQKPSSSSESQFQLWCWCLCWYCNSPTEFPPKQGQGVMVWFEIQTRQTQHGLLERRDVTRSLHVVPLRLLWACSNKEWFSMGKLFRLLVGGTACVVWPLGFLTIRSFATANQSRNHSWSSLSQNIESNYMARQRGTAESNESMKKEGACYNGKDWKRLNWSRSKCNRVINSCSGFSNPGVCGCWIGR